VADLPSRQIRQNLHFTQDSQMNDRVPTTADSSCVKQLIAASLAARQRAYAPYSQFADGGRPSKTASGSVQSSSFLRQGFIS
jgi:hypothetical protein